MPPTEWLKITELYFSHFRLKSEIQVALGPALSKAAPCFSPSFRGRRQSLGFLGWSACHRLHLLMAFSLSLCPHRASLCVSVSISPFSEDPSHIYGIRGPLCSSPTFSYLITWARTQFPKESHSRTLGVNTSTHLFRGHTSTPYRGAQVRQVLFAVCSMPGPGLNPGATEFPGRSLSSGNLQSRGERPTGVD